MANPCFDHETLHLRIKRETSGHRLVMTGDLICVKIYNNPSADVAFGFVSAVNHTTAHNTQLGLILAHCVPDTQDNRDAVERNGPWNITDLRGHYGRYWAVYEDRPIHNVDDEDVCPVCQESTFESDVPMMTTDCTEGHHTMHRHCLLGWIDSGHHSCPVCRDHICRGCM